MKVCKILHINDGQPKVITNGNFLFAEEYVRASDILNQYLADGWELRTMIPEFTPGAREDGPAFYCGGFTVYLEHDE